MNEQKPTKLTKKERDLLDKILGNYRPTHDEVYIISCIVDKIKRVGLV